jgi:hypothetical protein
VNVDDKLRFYSTSFAKMLFMKSLASNLKAHSSRKSATFSWFYNYFGQQDSSSIFMFCHLFIASNAKLVVSLSLTVNGSHDCVWFVIENVSRMVNRVMVKDTFCGIFMCHSVDESMDVDLRISFETWLHKIQLKIGRFCFTF